MIRIIGPKLPRTLYVAVSGGPDSMAIMDFLIRGKREVTALHFDHGTKHGAEARSFLESYAAENSIKLIVGEKDRERRKNESPEEYWRNMRYDFFAKYTDRPIVMAHNLDDQVENWLFTSFHGMSRLIPYSRNEHVIRPFITTTKAELVKWCKRKGVPYIVDPGNADPKYMRSLIRRDIVPLAMKVNPGIYKVIKKKILLMLDES